MIFKCYPNLKFLALQLLSLLKYIYQVIGVSQVDIKHWTIFQNHLLTQNWETVALQTLTTVGLF